jgi:tetratricopeptide (TPR) repeat protein
MLRIRRIYGPTLALFPQPTSLHSCHRSNFTSPWLKNQSQFQADVAQVHTMQPRNALGFFKRYTKWCFIAFSGIGVTLLSAAAATHLWIERVEFAPESDENCLEWQWDVEAERWGQCENGGTDPSLGFMARFGVRSAWLEHHWTSPGTLKQVKSESNKSTLFGDATTPVERRLETTRNFLDGVLDIALQKESAGLLRRQTVTDILIRRADVSERMGTKAGLKDALYDLQRVWSRLPAEGHLASRVALKLGDLGFRLGDPDNALSWWNRCLQMTSSPGTNTQTDPPLPVVPSSPPSSPAAQRTLASALVSLSAFYATSGRLPQAQVFEKSALDLLHTIQPPDLSSSASAPQTLHSLYILHRTSLISLHLAEVLYALKNPPAESMKWLSRAAQTSEQVALALAGLPPIHPNAPGSKIPHPPSPHAPLLPEYSKSPSMKKPAKSLIRDARRSAVEAWNLLGVLHEGKGDINSLQASRDCYERALGWAGVTASGDEMPAEGILEVEWKALNGNYSRVREILQAKLTDEPVSAFGGNAEK